MKRYSIYDCSMISLNFINSEKGKLVPIENGIDIPFEINRVYYLYDIPAGESRGGHAHKELYQLIIATSGSFEIMLTDGRIKRRFILNRPDIGLFLPPGFWREIDNISSGAICLVLASKVYSEDDYIRSYEEFIQFYK